MVYENGINKRYYLLIKQRINSIPVPWRIIRCSRCCRLLPLSFAGRECSTADTCSRPRPSWRRSLRTWSAWTIVLLSDARLVEASAVLYSHLALLCVGHACGQTLGDGFSLVVARWLSRRGRLLRDSSLL